MALRVSTQSTYSRVLLGIRKSQLSLVNSQEQVASGKRILRPSDDPTGAARSLSLTRQLADVGRYDKAITQGLVVVDTAASGLEDVSQLLSEARSILLQSMSGSVTQDDRDALATEFDLLRVQLLEIGNLKSGDRYLFGGTSAGEVPWEEQTVNGTTRVVYLGNGDEQQVRVGTGVDVSINVPGQDVFGKLEYMGTKFAGLTGVTSGLTADEGSGYEYLDVRHDSTTAATIASAGLGLVNGGSDDTLMGDNTLVIDATASTIQLGSGAVYDIPDASSAEALDFVVENEMGGQLHLDMSAFAGVDYSGTVTGNGSVSLDGSSYTPINFSESDLEVSNSGTGSVLHIDTSGIKRSGEELVTFRGTVNLFDLMQGISEDLTNSDNLDHPDLLNKLNDRLDELDRNQDNALVGLGVLGSRSQRLAQSSDRIQDVQLSVQASLSSVVDADFAEAALDLTRAEFTLQIAQASGARLIQTSLLNFLS